MARPNSAIASASRGAPARRSIAIWGGVTSAEPGVDGRLLPATEQDLERPGPAQVEGMGVVVVVGVGDDDPADVGGGVPDRGQAVVERGPVAGLGPPGVDQGQAVLPRAT